MRKRRLIISAMFLMVLVGPSCKYNPVKEKLDAYALDFSKRTANIWRATNNKPLEFSLTTEGISFDELEKKILDGDLDPLWCVETKQVQAMRRAYEDEIKQKNAEIQKLQPEVQMMKQKYEPEQ